MLPKEKTIAGFHGLARAYLSPLARTIRTAGLILYVILAGAVCPAQSPDTPVKPPSKTQAASAPEAQRSKPDDPVPDLSTTFLTPSEPGKRLSDIAPLHQTTGYALTSGRDIHLPVVLPLIRSRFCRTEENDVCYNVGKTVSAPLFVSSYGLPYPQFGSKKIQGIAILQVIVGPDGRVHDPTVIQSLSPDFDRQLIAAVEHWDFKPAWKGSKIVGVVIQFEIPFLYDRPSASTPSGHSPGTAATGRQR